MKIKVKLFNGAEKLQIIKKGDWIDLRANCDIELNGPKAFRGNVEFTSALIPLGVGMELPGGMEAIMAPRSSTYKTFGIIQWNSPAVIDNSYCGNNDEWRFAAIALRPTTICRGDRVCQFKIQPSQQATMWQKLRWLFSSKLEIEYVDTLESEDRKGFGEGTGAK